MSFTPTQTPKAPNRLPKQPIRGFRGSLALIATANAGAFKYFDTFGAVISVGG